MSRPIAVKMAQKRCSCRYWIALCILLGLLSLIGVWGTWHFSRPVHCDYTKWDEDNHDYICVIILEDL